MMGDPILHFVFGAFGVLMAAFVIGFLLFQFRLPPACCAITAEAATLLYYFVCMRPSLAYPDGWLLVLHVLSLPILLTPLFGGYYFNKCVIIHEH
jgi:hypothetical protein